LKLAGEMLHAVSSRSANYEKPEVMGTSAASIKQNRGEEGEFESAKVKEEHLKKAPTRFRKVKSE
jgi:hypothetical protein